MENGWKWLDDHACSDMMGINIACLTYEQSSRFDNSSDFPCCYQQNHAQQILKGDYYY